LNTRSFAAPKAPQQVAKNELNAQISQLVNRSERLESVQKNEKEILWKKKRISCATRERKEGQLFDVRYHFWICIEIKGCTSTNAAASKTIYSHCRRHVRFVVVLSIEETKSLSATKSH
jgi:hypothetical protein